GIDSNVLRQEFRAAATNRGKRTVEATAETQLIPAERVLIRALSSTLPEETGLRDRALAALEAKRLHNGLATEPLIDLLVQNLRSEAPQPAMDLALEESSRALLAKILLREEDSLSEELLEGALAALQHRADLAQRERDIKVAIQEAERRGDVKELLRLKQEKLELDRKLSGNKP